ncbi:hypothetical protein KR054_005941, partial [Drosophila jambulina]
IILLALVAFCQAAPLDSKESAPETSTLGVGPIAPDVISEPKPTEGKVVLLRDSPVNRQKRDEHKKPDSVKAREGLQHNPHRQPVEPPTAASAKTHEELQHSAHKREAHHEPGHQEQPQTEDLPVPHALPSAAPAAELPKKQEKRDTEEKPDSVTTKDSLAHHELLAPDSAQSHSDEHTAEKKVKREAHHEEGHQEQPQTEDLPVPHALPSAAPAAELSKKQEKRETQQKPDSVEDKESQNPPQLGAADVPDVVKALSGVHPASDLLKKQEKRDIPVPTQTKATAEPAATTKSEGGSTTPASPHFKRPVPVDVLLHQNHAEKSSSSSEESKESKEK